MGNSKRNISILRWFNGLALFVPYTPVAILYFAKVSGSYALAGSVFAITMVSSAVLDLPTGVLSDLLGKKKVLILSAAANLLSIVLFASATSYLFLCIGAVLGGLSQALSSGNNEALFYENVRDHHGEEHFSSALGSLNSMIQITLGASAVVGGIAAAYSYSLVMWLSVIPMALALGLSFFLTDAHRVTAPQTKPHLHLLEAWHLFLEDQRLRLVSLYSILTEGIGGAAYQLLPAFYATVVPTWVLGIVNLINKVSVYLSFRFAQPLIKRWGEKKLLVINHLVVQIAPLAGLTFPTAVSPFYMSADGALWGAAAVAKSALSQRSFSDTHRATMGSMTSFATSFMFGLASLGLGVLADYTSARVMLIAAQIVLLPTIFLILRAYRNKKQLQGMQ